MLKIVFSDNEIIADIKSTEKSRVNKALKYIYENNYLMALNIVKKNGGTEEEVIDVFQESIIALYESIKNNKFRGDSKISTWLHSTIFNQWSASTRKSKKRNTDSIENFNNNISIEDEKPKDYTELLQIINNLLELIGKTCKEVLVDYYYNKFSMEEIKEKMGFKTVQVAKNKKYRCKEKLDGMISEKPGLKQYLNRLYDEG